MNESTLKKRYATKLFASIISGIIGMVIVAIVPKAIGPIAYGQFVYLQQFFTKVIGFLDAGSSIAFFTKLSAKPERKELISFYSFYSLFVLFVLSIFFYVVDLFGYTHYLLPDVNSDYIYWGIGFCFLTWISQLCIKISDAYALTVSVELIKIAHKILSLCLLVYFIYFLAFDLTKYFYFHIISLVTFIGWISYLFIKSSILSRKILSINYATCKSVLSEFVTYCTPLLSYSIVGLFVGLFDIWLLQSISGSIQTGYYGLAYSLAAMCFIFTGAMAPIITREFSKSYEQKDLQKMRTLFKRYIPMLYSIAAYFAIFISFQSGNVLSIFTDEQFLGAYWVLVVIALYPIHQTYGQLSGSIFYATGQTKLYRNIGLVTMLIGFLLTLLLVYIFELNALGLAFKMIISQIIGVNIQLYFNIKFLKLDMKKFIWHQIYSVAFFAVAAFLSTNWVNCNNSLIDFLISGFIYTGIVLIGSFYFPQIFSVTREELKKYIATVKR
ncbi:MAG: O-antigen/teichoic acid export membrane protein [Oleiphilaceae bacterium]|jgi:O-antigen/teichoic acid export membrane protein